MVTALQNEQKVDEVSLLEEAGERARKKRYNAPELKIYGNLRTLTQAGSRGHPEGASGRPSKKA